MRRTIRRALRLFFSWLEDDVADEQQQLVIKLLCKCLCVRKTKDDESMPIARFVLDTFTKVKGVKDEALLATSAGINYVMLVDKEDVAPTELRKHLEFMDSAKFRLQREAKIYGRIEECKAEKEKGPRRVSLRHSLGGSAQEARRRGASHA